MFLLDSFNHCETGPSLYRHELGHALGYAHIFAGDSIMGGSLTFTRFDLESVRILAQRGPGNRVPDIDRTGSSLNLTGPAVPGSVIAWNCEGWVAGPGMR